MKSKRNIPFFDYPRVFRDEEDDLIRIIKDVGGRGSFILQKELFEFEREFARFTGSEYSIGVANATDGLELCLMALGLSPGDEVIISSHTMLATASCIKLVGCIPVPVDVGEDRLINPDAIIAAITPRTVGIIPTQLNGRTCNMDLICKIAIKHGLFVVEDAAQALGSRFKGKHAGTFGIASAFSFYPAKVLGCLGDGGAVLCQTKDVYSKLYQLHDHGRDTDGEIKSWGRNSRLDNIQAAILNYRLAKYGDVILRRRQIASMYQKYLGDLSELKLPPPPINSDAHYDIYQNYELEAFRRDELRLFLASQGIGTLVQWGGKAVHQWSSLGFKMSLPVVEDFFTKCIMLPINMFLDDEDIVYVCDNIRAFYKA